jgi:hypothetical protein
LLGLASAEQAAARSGDADQESGREDAIVTQRKGSIGVHDAYLATRLA